jgi:hypothetical protein
LQPDRYSSAWNPPHEPKMRKLRPSRSALRIFRGYVFQHQLIQAQLRYQALQLGVLSLKLLQSPGLIQTVQFELEPSLQKVMQTADEFRDRYDSAQQSAGAGKICGRGAFYALRAWNEPSLLSLNTSA